MIKRAMIILPWFLVGGLLFGGTAAAASHQDQLDGLTVVLKAILDAFTLYLGSL